MISPRKKRLRLELGYVYLADGRLFPVDEVGLNIWDIGENGSPPTDYHFTFKAGDFYTNKKVHVIPCRLMTYHLCT
jgi:hypothetical protein